MPEWVRVSIFWLGLFAVSRIVVSLFFAEIQELKMVKSKKSNHLIRHNSFSILIPAYNESVRIKQCVLSALNVDYDEVEVIVINDGSTDDTFDQLMLIKAEYPNLIIINQTNGGKSVALNNGLLNQARNDLVMVLDADSRIEPDSLTKMNFYFQNQDTVAVAANVRIDAPKKFIERTQFIEYLLGYHLKNSEIPLRVQYIIGGIGSTFNRRKLAEINGYDTDTVTEDIDLTLKMLKHFGNLPGSFNYANDVICYTPPVHTFSELLKQRFRWKLGRFKALIKYRSIIFNSEHKYSWRLSFWKLPKVWIEEFLMLIDPLFTLIAVYCIARYGDFSTYISVVLLYSFFTISSFFTAEKMKIMDKVKLFLTAPFSYFLLEIIAIVDYVSLIRCVINPRQPFAKFSTWEHVKR